MVDNVESYCEDGVWKSRWEHSAEPFATGGSPEQQIAQGATVAQWYGVDHIVRNPDGSVGERNSYRPPESPAPEQRLDRIGREDTPGALAAS